MESNVRNISFNNYCYYCNKDLKKIIRKDRLFFDNWIKYGIAFYDDISSQGNNLRSEENPILAGFLAEMIDTLDGINILHNVPCINAANPLVRKLFEIYLQIIYLLKDNSKDKAIAHEAYFISRNKKGSDEPRDIFTKYPSYKGYKKLADKAYDEKPKFYEWYTVYNPKIDSLQKLSIEVNEKELYFKVYNLLSKKSHGLFSRENVLVHTETNVNYLRSYRYPGDIIIQIAICDYILGRVYSNIIAHYRLRDENLVDTYEKQHEIMHDIELRWGKYMKTVDI